VQLPIFDIEENCG